MTIALMMSQDRLDEEHGLLNRLAVGLMNEGNHIVRVIPPCEIDLLPDYEKAVSLAHRVMAAMPTSFLLRKTRQIEIATDLQQEHVSKIIAFGKPALQLALDVKQHIHVPVIHEIITAADVKKVKSNSAVNRWITPSKSIERMIESKVGHERVAYVPYGAGNIQKNPEHTKEQRCIVILDAATNIKNTKSILTELQSQEDLHIFIELFGKHQHKIWKFIRNLDMLSRVTCLQNVSDLRSLIIDCDLIALPNSNMQMRSIVLESMRCKVPIVCTSMQGYDMLIDEETALFANENWATPLHRILNDPITSRQICRNASELILEKHRSTDQITAFETAITLN